MKTSLAVAALSTAALSLVAAPAQADHILGYAFDDAPGTTSAANGTTSTGGAPVVQFQTGDGAVDRFGPAGSGVSGAPGDRAFDNTGATAMGGATSGGARAANLADYEPIDALTQFTIAGWFKTDGATPIGNNAILLYNKSNSTNGFEVSGNPNLPGGIQVSVDGSNAFSTADFGATQQYVNFAVTYDGTNLFPGTGTMPVSNVQFFVGGIDQAITAAGTGNIGRGQVDNDTSPLNIGGRAAIPGLINGTAFAFDGLIDNVRIWDRILTPAELEAARLGDGGNAVPEPASLAVIGLGGLALLRRRRA